MTAAPTLPDVPPLTDPFVERVGLALDTMLPPQSGERILVALSGGPDSCALLAALCSLAADPGRHLGLSACHVNHGLRGHESDEDEAFCRQLCRRWHVPLRIERLGGTVRSEAALREGRYAALTAAAAADGTKFIATAHTLDDQAETLLFRLFRGSSPAGLVGILPLRPLSDGVELLRPMLALERVDVLAVLDRIGLSARQDSTNEQTDYARNYIRGRVVPAIRERFPAFNRSVERLCNLLEQDEHLLSQLANSAAADVLENADTWSVRKLLAQPLSIQRRLIAEALRIRTIEVTFERANALLQLVQRGEGALSLDSRWDAVVANGVLLWKFKADADETAEETAEPVSLCPSGLTIALPFACAIEVQPLASNERKITFRTANADEALVDLSKMQPPLVVRYRRPGDTIQPFGMAEQVKLKKFLHTRPRAATGRQPSTVVVADANEVVWVPGVGLSEKLRVVGQPTHRLRFMPLLPDETGIC